MIRFNTIDVSFRIENRRNIKLWLGEIIRERNGDVGEICVALCSDAYMHEANKQYLNHDFFTDILTFDYCKGGLIEGDLLISYERVKENAKSEGFLVQEELRRVIVHGVFHLLGLGDKTEQQAEEMRKAENWALKKFHVEHQ